MRYASDHPGLYDNHGRLINYLRLSITDRCNLRCRYCRPAVGVPFIPHDEILRHEEILRLATIFAELGISKIRVTGGEPFVRKGCMDLIARLCDLPGIKAVHLTSNGVEVAQYVSELARLGIAGINLSLDTLDRRRFWSITRRDLLAPVRKTLDCLLASSIPVKINTVVLDDTTDAELLRIAELAREKALTVRFIEKMSFAGDFRHVAPPEIGLADRLQKLFPGISVVTTAPGSTARLFRVRGFAGNLGVIEGNSRKFCASCNKVRLTSVGVLKACLYDSGVLDLRNMVRTGRNDIAIKEAIRACVNNRFVNGLQAEAEGQGGTLPSMSSIGG